MAIAHLATPNDAEVWDAAGAIDRRQGRWSDAVPNFEKARELDPRNSAVLWNLAETYACVGRFEDADRAFADGFAIHPEAHLFSLAQAAIGLKIRGDTGPLRSALRKIPGDFDPGGAVTTIALRVSLIDGDYSEGERLLRASPHEKFNDTGVGGPAAVFDGCTLPKAWFEGLIARGRGELDAAERAFAAAQRVVETDLAQWRDDAKTMAMLGVLQALRGRKEEAVRSGRRAVELLPISKDAYDGPLMATKLAAIYAQVGELDLAHELLADLVRSPNGPTAGTLRVEPEWEPLRGDPRFEKLLNASVVTT